MRVLWRVLAETPSPSPSVDPTFDANTVTPGWIGFVITFLVAVLTVLLIMDMVRRIRRVRYREEVRAKLLAEQADSQPRDEPSAGLPDDPSAEDRKDQV